MANALLQDLAAATTLAGSDLFYVKQAGARGVKATGTQLLALVGTAYVPLAGGTMTGALTLPAGTVSAPALQFTGGGSNTGLYLSGATELSISVAGVRIAAADTGGFYATTTAMGIYSNTGYLSLGLANDIRLYRDAAATLAQRNGTNQQSFSVYNTYTDSSNYERLKLTGVAGTSVNITAETLGTGGDNIHIVLTPAGTGAVRIDSGAKQLRVAQAWTDTGNYRAIIAGDIGGILALGTFAYGTGAPAGKLGIYVENNGVWSFGTTAAFYPEADNSHDIGATSNKVRSLYVGTSVVNSGYEQLTEMTAPSAPATNSVRIYAEDNGAGKTRLMALFATGAAVQLGIEP